MQRDNRHHWKGKLPGTISPKAPDQWFFNGSRPEKTCMGGAPNRHEVVKTMLIVATILSAGVAAWLGYGYASTGPATLNAPGPIGASHADSHRLGALIGTSADLPLWEERDISGVSPVMALLADNDQVDFTPGL